MRARPARNAGSAKESLGQLLEALVTLALRAREDPRDMRMKARLTPSVPGGLLRVSGRAVARALEERRRSGGLEPRVVARGE